MATVKEKLIFKAIITSGARNSYYTPVTYYWDYGDGNTEDSTKTLTPLLDYGILVW